MKFFMSLFAKTMIVALLFVVACLACPMEAKATGGFSGFGGRRARVVVVPSRFGNRGFSGRNFSGRNFGNRGFGGGGPVFVLDAHGRLIRVR